MDSITSTSFDVRNEHMLNGIFAPTRREIDAPDLRVVQGKIPDDLNGHYLRNGPNPRFTPIGSYTFPLDGDAMVHGVWFEGGRARYRNRFVRTPVMQAEERAGRALWGGTNSGIMPSAGEVPVGVGAEGRDAPFVHVIHHAQRYLALAESAPAYELSPDLGTLGEYDFGGVLPRGITAHPRIDLVTGEMFVFRYGLEEPFLTWSAISNDGVASREQSLNLDAPYMIHDCVLTENYFLIFVCPVVIDLSGPERGEHALQWHPDRGTRIAVIARDGSGVRWLDVDAFWVWHFANAYETAEVDGARSIIIDFPFWTHPGMGIPGGPGAAGMAQARIDLARGTVCIKEIDDLAAEFPRLDDRLIGRQNRYFHVVGKDVPVVGEWNEIRRYDLKTGSTVVRRTGSTKLGEAVFAPRDGSVDENDGYLLVYAYDTETLNTNLLVLHASDIAGEPAATIQLPQRVPFGLHGSWIPA